MIYLDNAASTRPAPEVRAAMEPYLGDAYGNASSPHAAGRRARKAVEDARETVAAALGADPKEILFTSGATESNNLALAGRSGVVTSAVEHPCVLESSPGAFRLPVDAQGRVDPASIPPGAGFVSIQWANHETGVLQPIRELRRAAGKALFHSDAAQALGKVPVDLRDVDLLTFSGHKLHGPKGAGALWVRRGTPLTPLLVGGGQEFERRAGTENVAAIVGLAEAVRRALSEGPGRMEALRDRLQEELAGRVFGPPAPRAPHLLSMAFEGVEAEALVLALDGEGICISAGAACASMSLEPSPVLRAMGVPLELARSAVRFSLSRYTTEAEIETVARVVPRVVERLRKRTPAVR